MPSVTVRGKATLSNGEVVRSGTQTITVTKPIVPPEQGAFYGDRPGRILLGQTVTTLPDGGASGSLAQDAAQIAYAETQGGKKLGGQRIFEPDIARARQNMQNGRVPFLSFKPPHVGGPNGDSAGWAYVAAGSADTQIRNILIQLRDLTLQYNLPAILIFCHEPIGPNRTNPSMATGYCNAWRRIRTIFNALAATSDMSRVHCVPNHEEFVFNADNTVGLEQWHPADLMTWWRFMTFDVYMNSGVMSGQAPPNDRLTVRLPVIFDFFDDLGYPDLRYAIMETGARNSFKTANSSLVSASAWAATEWPYLLTLEERLWAILYYNSVGSNTSQLNQPKMTGDSLSLLERYKVFNSNSVILHDLRDGS